ncbi:hypothetical protein BGZ88_005015 [Linnemannia elongata]|nr:hypothetical protein BGZ88_005015 [Linnemannia elongata]
MSIEQNSSSAEVVFSAFQKLQNGMAIKYFYQSSEIEMVDVRVLPNGEQRVILKRRYAGTMVLSQGVLEDLIWVFWSPNSDDKFEEYMIQQPRVVAGPTDQAPVVSASMTPVPTTTQLLLCPVCSQPFKPSKNENSNLRRHIKNIHKMSPTMHPRKCKWDSIPGGRIKDDKDRNERIRKSKRLWARKTRLRRKAEEAALGLCMLSEAV